MGGHVCVAVRRSDGREVVYERWTNPMPFWLIDPLFRCEDEATLARFDQVVRDAEAEAKRDKTVWHSRIIHAIEPIEYGLIAVDFKTKDILSCQGYCTPGHWHTLWHDGRSSSGDEWELSIVHRLLEEGVVPTVGFPRPGEPRTFAPEYIDKLRVAIATMVREPGRYAAVPDFAISMEWNATAPFTAQHQSDYPTTAWWRTIGCPWFAERQWTTRVILDWEDDLEEEGGDDEE